MDYLYCQNNECGTYLGSLGASSCISCGWKAPVDAASPDAGELWDANPNCQHETYDAPGGGIKCRHCAGWFCF